MHIPADAQASDFLEGFDSNGAPVIPEALAALLRGADGAHGHPICVDNPQSLAKVRWAQTSQLPMLVRMHMWKVSLRFVSHAGC